MRYGWSTRLAGFVPAGLVAACLATPPAADSPDGSGAASGAETASLAAKSPAPIDWSQGDCLSRLRMLQQAASEGRLTPDDRPAFAVELVPASADWLDAAPDIPIEADLPLMVEDASPTGHARCIIRIGPARDQHAEHRAVDVEDVRSAYQSALRRERNPDYDLAQLKHRQAKDDAKGRQEVVHVGDPLLDLIGTTVGGVIGTLDQRLRQHTADDAAAELASTPRSIDRPVYRSYSFERIVVRAQKQAVVPVTLLDARGQALRSAELRQRERREFFVLRGLDPRDRDYEQHRSSSMTRADLARWSRTPPALRLSTVAIALTEGGSQAHVAELAPAAGPAVGGTTQEPDRLEQMAATDPLDLPMPQVVDSDPTGIGAEADPWSDDAAFADDLDAPMRPQDISVDRAIDPSLVDWVDDARSASDWRSAPNRPAREAGPRGALTGPAPTKAPSTMPGATQEPYAASVVVVHAGGPAGNGFYVRRDLVLTAYRLVGAAAVVDVTTADGFTVPALVAAVDPAYDLALLHVPRPGPALSLYQGGAVAAGQVDGPPDQPGRPVFWNDRVVAMTTGHAGEPGDVVPVDAIHAFLDSQASLLAAVP
jgi:hypothetical protein